MISEVFAVWLLGGVELYTVPWFIPACTGVMISRATSSEEWLAEGILIP